jgi:hypothetical protein
MIGFPGALVKKRIWKLREVISRPDLTRSKLYIWYRKAVKLAVLLGSVFNCTPYISSGNNVLF